MTTTQLRRASCVVLLALSCASNEPSARPADRSRAREAIIHPSLRQRSPEEAQPITSGPTTELTPASGSAPAAKHAPPAPSRTPDVIYVPTPQPVVERMLQLAQVSENDLVYDLGCGDGRIVVTAAKTYGARARGFDVDPRRVAEAKANVMQADVQHLVTIEQRDIFTVDLSPASIVTLYLLPQLNVRLIPQLEKLRPGSRIVSHDFDMAGIKPLEYETVQSDGGVSHSIYFWKTPLIREPRAGKGSLP